MFSSSRGGGLMRCFQFAIERNFAANLFSVYDPSSPSPFFQIDANLGYPSVVLVRIVVLLWKQST